MNTDCYLTNQILLLSDKEIKQLLGVPKHGLMQYINERKAECQMFKVGHPVSISSAEEVIIFLLHFRHYFTPFVLAVFARLTSKVIEGCTTNEAMVL